MRVAFGVHAARDCVTRPAAFKRPKAMDLTRGKGSEHNSERKAKFCMASPLKLALEELLRDRRLLEAPLLRANRPLDRFACGVPAVDTLLGGGIARGQVSEIHGPRSSGRTGLALALVARATRAGALAVWVDATDSLDPATAAAGGLDLARLLWVRGEPKNLKGVLAAAGLLLESGLFEVAVLDVADVDGALLRRVPATTWMRLARLVEGTPSALVLLSDHHVYRGASGVSLALHPKTARWSGAPGPGRLLAALATEASAWAGTQRRSELELPVVDR